MKQRLLLVGIMMTSLTVMFAQQRYQDYIFEESDITVNESIIYGTNFTVLLQAQTGHTEPQPLVMDVYSPNDSTEDLRPLIVYLHTGNFLPVALNGGVNGTIRDSSTVFTCKRLSRLGYVVASADYRLGWLPTAETQSTRNFTLINAAYRGVQDVRSCIRYFKRTVAEEGNPYQIDTSRIVVWGARYRRLYFSGGCYTG